MYPEHWPEEEELPGFKEVGSVALLLSLDIS